MLKEAWTLAIETLSWMQMQRLNERMAMARTIKQLGVTDFDAMRLARLLVYETVRRRNFIDKFVNAAIRPNAIGQFDLGVQAFLRLYVYHTRVAKNWAVANFEEAGNIASQARSILGWKPLQPIEPFLGVLLMQKPSTIFKEADDEERIALSTFHPEWYVRYCINLLGRSETIAMLEANVQVPPIYVRLNTLKADQNRILEKFEEEGVSVEKLEQLEHTFKVLDTKVPLNRTSFFEDGLFYIQDKASCFAAEAVDPKPGMTVLDLCAAPGAKTTYLAQLMQNQGTIFSLDYSRRRMTTWTGEVARMGVKIAEPMIADACSQLPLTEKVDMIVVDPPSTGTGVFARLPSAKWRVTLRSIDRMAQIQWRILNNCAESLNQEGTLVYSTYTVTIEENEMLIERFLKWHPEFRLVDIRPNLGLPGLRGLDKCRRLYPHIHGCDGLFIARLFKKET